MLGLEAASRSGGSPKWIASSNYEHILTTWEDFVARCAMDARQFIQSFASRAEVLFSISWVEHVERLPQSFRQEHAPFNNGGAADGEHRYGNSDDTAVAT